MWCWVVLGDVGRYLCDLAGVTRCRVQASRLVRSTPPGSTPAHRPDAGVHVKAGAESNVERRPLGFSLDGVASGGRVVEMPGGTARRERTRRAAMPREAQCGQTLLYALRAPGIGTTLGCDVRVR